MQSWNFDVGAWPIVWTGFLQGVGAGIILVPIQALAFPTLEPRQRTEAAAVFNLVRSVGSSIGVSVMLTLFTRASGASRAQLAEHVSPYNELLRYEHAARSWDKATLPGLAAIEREIAQQAAILAYMADFRLLAIAALAGLPLLLLIGRTRRGAVVR